VLTQYSRSVLIATCMPYPVVMETLRQPADVDDETLWRARAPLQAAPSLLVSVDSQVARRVSGCPLHLLADAPCTLRALPLLGWRDAVAESGRFELPKLLPTYAPNRTVPFSATRATKYGSGSRDAPYYNKTFADAVQVWRRQNTHKELRKFTKSTFSDGLKLIEKRLS
jgi:hypothetical protein